MRNPNRFNQYLKVHPLGKFKSGRVDVIHATTQIPVMQAYGEAVEIARQQMASLTHGEGVLFINLVTFPGQIEYDTGYIRSARNSDAGEFASITLRAGQFASKLAFFDKMMKEKAIRTVILCGLEFASDSARHKRQIMNWLKDLRDYSNKQIVVVMILPPSGTALDATLRQLSSSVNVVGEYASDENAKTLPSSISRVKEAPEMERVEWPNEGIALRSESEPAALEADAEVDVEEGEDADDHDERIEQHVDSEWAADITLYPNDGSKWPQKVWDAVQAQTLKNKELDQANVSA